MSQEHTGADVNAGSSLFGTRLQTNEKELRLVCELLRDLEAEVVGVSVTFSYFDLAALVAVRPRSPRFGRTPRRTYLRSR